MKAYSIAILLAAASFASEPFIVESNVVFGMYSGTALLLDVYKPAQPNGYGVIYISGSGWTAPLAYSAESLKSNSQSRLYSTALAGAGYTVFAVNHRAVPRFRYPAWRGRAIRFSP
jgi:acetyl esterase/lipase